jgi:hypothetical protein
VITDATLRASGCLVSTFIVIAAMALFRAIVACV